MSGAQEGEYLELLDKLYSTAIWRALYTFFNHTQQTQNIIFIQHRPKVFDVGSTLYKCYTNALRLLDKNVFSPKFVDKGGGVAT